MHECGADLGYAAGFIDGDGCISIYLRTKSSSLVPLFNVQLMANGIDERPLVRLQLLFGGTIHLKSKNGPLGKRPIYYWVIQGEAAVESISILLPFLIVKREQAELAIRADALVREQRELLGFTNRDWRGCEQEVKELREGLREQMRVLNSGNPER